MLHANLAPLTLLALCFACGGGGPSSAASTGTASRGDEVTINGAVPDPMILAYFETRIGAKVPAGEYWYDTRSGLGGPWGEHATVYVPGFDFGPLPANASDGDTEIFYNGRELKMIEARFVAALFGIPEAQIPLFRGRYVLESTGDLFTEDGAYLGNLADLAALAVQSGSSGGCTAVRIPSSAPSPSGVKQTIDVATGTNC